MNLIILSISKDKQKINSKKVIYVNLISFNFNYKELKIFFIRQ